MSTIVLKKEYNTISDILYISKSKIRRELLAIFFTNPAQKYYLRELQRTLGYSAGNIRRELIKFQSDGLLNTQRIGNLLYYSLNTRHPLFNELKAIVAKTVGVEGSLRKSLSSLKNLEVAFIYGSFAKNKENAASDIDLFIIGNIEENKLISELRKLEKGLQREINYSLYSRQDFIKQKRKRNSFIVDLLENPKKFLIGDEDDL